MEVEVEMEREPKRMRCADKPSAEGDGEQLNEDVLSHVFKYFSTRALLAGPALVCTLWSRVALSQVREIVPDGLGGGKISKRQLIYLINKCGSNIERVDLTIVKGGQLSRDLMSKVFALVRLKHMTLTVYGDTLERFSSLFPQTLESLNLSFLDKAPPESYCFMSRLHGRSPFITSLTLGQPIVTPEQISVMGEKFIYLTFLDLTANSLNYDHVSAIFKSCTTLTSFSLVSEKLIGLCNLTDFPPGLSSIRLLSSPSKSISYISCKPLMMKSGHQLKAIHAHSVFNASWQLISENCPNLTVLDLSSIKFLENALSQHEEEVLSKLPTLLPLLERVCMPMVTDNILKMFGRSCPSLLEFRFQGIGKGRSTFPITDWGVGSLVEGCKKLEILSLESCENLTIAAARAIAFYCHNLKVLHFRGCKLIEDDSIYVLLPRLKDSLRLLDIHGCSITVATLFLLQNNFTNLRVVAINRKLTNHRGVMSDLKITSPRLRVFTREAPYEWTGFYHAPNLNDL